MNVKEKTIKNIIEDMQSIFVRNPSNMNWSEIGKILYNKGWRKEK